MESTKTDLHNKRLSDRAVHKILAHSYSFSFIFLLIGVTLDMIFPIKIFQHASVMPIGFVFLIAASALIFWAQHSTRHLHKRDHVTKNSFLVGPYRYMRTPTHLGLFILTLGFGVVANAFFVVVTTILAFIFSKLTFLRKYDVALEKRYGESYLEYEKEVKI